jgi:hypothetical protein
MATSLTNMNSHPISAKLRRDGPNGTKVIDYITVMPKVKVTVPPHSVVDKNWLSGITGVTLTESDPVATEAPKVIPPVVEPTPTTPGA